MWGILAALGIVGGLVAATCREKSDDPVIKPALQRARLARLAGKRRLTLPEAEDGVVLSRKLGEADLARKFERVASRLKQARARR